MSKQNLCQENQNISSLGNSDFSNSNSPQNCFEQNNMTKPTMNRFDKDEMITFLLNEFVSKNPNEIVESFFNRYLNFNSGSSTESNFKTYINFWDSVPDLDLLFARTIKHIYIGTPKSPEKEEKTILTDFQDTNNQFEYLENVIINSEMDKSVINKIAELGNPELNNITQLNVIHFLLHDNQNSLIGITQIMRQSQFPFSQEEIEMVKWFIEKFELVYKVSISNEFPPILEDVLQVLRTDQLFNLSCSKIAQTFNARRCEIWKIEKAEEAKDTNRKRRYSFNTDDKTDETIKAPKYLVRCTDRKTIIPYTEGGIAGDAIRSDDININIDSSFKNPFYDPEFDGDTDQPILIHNIQYNGSKFAIVLRGNNTYPIFLQADIRKMTQLSQIFTISFTNSEKFTEIDNEIQKNRIEKEGLTALLDVAEEISGQLDTNKLTEVIIEKGRLLTNADRCSLFLVNESHDRLITTLQSGLSTKIDIPIDCGIVGKTVIENRTFNIPDAYKCEYFDSSTDQNTGYRTRQILSVPIRNNIGEVIGVTEMVNRIDDKPFTSWDVNLIQIFNIFCGISLENAKLYQKSVAMASQLRSFMNMSFSLSKTDSIHRILTDIMENGRRSINAESCTLFLFDEASEELATFITDGQKQLSQSKLIKTIATMCLASKEEIIVNDLQHDDRFNTNIDSDTLASIHSLIAVPLMKSDNETIIGVAEMVNKYNSSFTPDDSNMMKSFSTFAAIALENSRLKEIEKYGNVETEMMKWVSESERSLIDVIPEKLRFQNEETKEQLLTINVFSCDFDGIEHIKTVFYIFDRFHVCSQFNISNEMLFKFAFELWKTYNDVPYHNWTHACDVLQYTAYELHIGQLEKIFTSMEIFGLLVAAICHDANHNGYNNIYNIKSETPLGILFKGQSVMETHHVTVTINLLEKDETNLFYSFSKENVRKMWNLLIKLILSTDMALHFNLIKNTSTLLDTNEFSFENDEHRQIALSLLLKVADISNASRPFEIADKWCTILQEEFFRQGDMEKANGIELSSPMNDRENSDKPKSQIGFYNFICLPLYQLTARVFPNLQVNVDHVKENLAVWMSIVKKNEELEKQTENKKE